MESGQWLRAVGTPQGARAEYKAPGAGNGRSPGRRKHGTKGKHLAECSISADPVVTPVFDGAKIKHIMSC